MNDLNENVVTAIQIVGFFGIVVVIGGVAWLLITGLLKAGTLRPTIALVIALSMLTLVSLVGFVVTQGLGNQSVELITVAATGMGALAGAVANTWGDRDNPVPVVPATGFQSLPPEYVPVPTPNAAELTEEAGVTDEWLEENPFSPSPEDLAEEAVEPELPPADSLQEDVIDAEEGWTPTLADDSEPAEEPEIEGEVVEEDKP